MVPATQASENGPHGRALRTSPLEYKRGSMSAAMVGACDVYATVLRQQTVAQAFRIRLQRCLRACPLLEKARALRMTVHASEWEGPMLICSLATNGRCPASGMRDQSLGFQRQSSRYRTIRSLALSWSTPPSDRR